MKTTGRFFLVLGLALMSLTLGATGRPYAETPTVTITSAATCTPYPNWVQKTAFLPGEQFVGKLVVSQTGVTWMDHANLKFAVPLFNLTANEQLTAGGIGTQTYYGPQPWYVPRYWSIPRNSFPNLQSWDFSLAITLQRGTTFSNTASIILKNSIKRTALINSTAASQLADPPTPVGVPTKPFIINQCFWVNKSLTGSPLKFGTTQQGSSPSAQAFLNSLKQIQPQVVLVHAKPGTTDLGGLYFLDNSYLNSTLLHNSGLQVCSGLVFLAAGGLAGNGLLYSAPLAQEFIRCGYNQVISFTDPYPYQYRIAAFYNYFFQQAVVPNVYAETARYKACNWADQKKWYDVRSATSLYNSLDGTWYYIFLGGGPEPPPQSPGVRPRPGATPATFPRRDPWREVTTNLMTHEEMLAVHEAAQVQAVQQLQEKYGSALRTGMVHYPGVYRVVYKVKNTALYGVDLDKDTGRVIDQGEI